MIDKKVLQMHFNRSAVNYDTYADVQKKMACELLNMASFNYRNKIERIDILDIGCGTGYLTEKLLSCYPIAEITAVDIASGMIEFARKKFFGKNVEFQCLDIEEADFNKKYDMIISNAAFQWFNHLEGTIEKLGYMLKNNGVLAFSTFGDMTFNELRHSYEIAGDKLKIGLESSPSQKFYSSEKILEICMRKFNDASSNIYDITNTERHEYFYFKTCRDFLDSVKKVGANNSNRNRRANTALTREMIKTYEALYKEDGHVKATYHCIFFTVKKLNPT